MPWDYGTSGSWGVFYKISASFAGSIPAISRKRSIEGIAIKSAREAGSRLDRAIGSREEMFDITHGHRRFHRQRGRQPQLLRPPTHTYLDMNAGRDFEREIIVKVNVPELVRAELARPTWRRELVALGTNTDPYQWVESRYRMMPEIIAALEEADTPISVLTKSPLVMRDVELYERMAKRLPVSVNLSIPTLDPEVWRATEPHTPSPEARLEAVAELRRRGIDSGVLIAPLMPGINDSPEQVQPIVDRAREAGATFLGGVALHLRDEVRDVFFGWLESKRPDLIPKYEQLYSDRAYLRPSPAPARHPRRPRLGPNTRTEEAGGDQAQEARRRHHAPGRPAPACELALRHRYPPGGSVLSVWRSAGEGGRWPFDGRILKVDP